jgi:triosephosphate isomerase
MLLEKLVESDVDCSLLEHSERRFRPRDHYRWTTAARTAFCSTAAPTG